LSDHDAYPDDMARRSNPSDVDVERLLTGKAPEGQEELAAFVRDVKSLYERAPSEPTARDHLAAMADATHSTAEAHPAPSRKLVRMPTLSRAWAKVALATVATALLMSGLAVASALPDPVQSAFAGAADRVGISLDDPDEPNGENNDFDDGDVGNRDDRSGDGQSHRSGESGESSGGGQSGQSGQSGDQ
jgi:hypothetical protein